MINYCIKCEKRICIRFIKIQWFVVFFFKFTKSIVANDHLPGTECENCKDGTANVF
jgi:hypothetical protein